MTERQVDIAVVGGGLVGAAAACLLARQEQQVLLLDRQRPAVWQQNAPRDLRVFAISPGSARVLQACGVWDDVAQARVSPYQVMEVTTEAGGTLRFQAHEHGLPQLGWIVENRLIQTHLWQNLEPRIDIAAPGEIVKLVSSSRSTQIELADGSRITARLLVAADGARSFIRQQLEMPVSDRDYQQQALVAELDTHIPNDGTAWQIFLDTGPLAFLPLDDGRSSMVWSLPAERAAAIQDWDAQRLGAELTLASNGRFGQVKVASKVVGFPLYMLLAEHMRSERVLLLGDAAHQVHPLAGQGVNLGLQDAAALAQCLSGVAWRDADAVDAALARFERWRISENTLMARGIDGIERLFKRMPAVGGAGLGLVQRLWPVKDRFLQHACGLHAGAPDICRQ